VKPELKGKNVVYLSYISAVTTEGVWSSQQSAIRKPYSMHKDIFSSSEHFSFRRISGPLHSQVSLNIIAATTFMSTSTFHIQYAFSICASIVDVFDEHRLGKETSVVTNKKNS
jgi:hypothetical protein